MEEILTAEQLIQQITNLLRTYDGESLQKVAQQLILDKVSYEGDSMFKITEIND